MSKEKKEIVPVEDKFEKEEDFETVDAKEKEEVLSETRYSSEKTGIGGIIIAILALLLVCGILLLGYRYTTTGTISHSSEPAQEIIKEQENPELKANKLNPQLAYNLKDASDVVNNMEITLTKIQFRQDGTRVWVHLKNTGAQKVSMMPNVNSKLVDNNGHSYKVDSFAGTNVTDVSPGTDEDIMLVFAPVRSDAKRITFYLDSVFDMKNPAWSYSIPVDLP